MGQSEILRMYCVVDHVTDLKVTCQIPNLVTLSEMVIKM